MPRPVQPPAVQPSACPLPEVPACWRRLATTTTTLLRPAVARMQRQLEEGGDPQAREGFASVLVSSTSVRLAPAAASTRSPPVQCAAAVCCFFRHRSRHADHGLVLPACLPAAVAAASWPLAVQICESDGEAAAALEAWSLYGPSHPDPAAEYARLRPPPPKAAALNTIDRFFKKVLKPAPAEQAAQAGEGGQPAAAGAQGNAGEAHAHAPQQKQKEPTASPSSTGHPRQQQQQHQGGSGGGDAFQALMAAARPQPRPGAAAGPASPASGGAGPSGGKSKHGFDGQASWASSLATIAAKPERWVGAMAGGAMAGGLWQGRAHRGQGRCAAVAACW